MRLVLVAWLTCLAPCAAVAADPAIEPEANNATLRVPSIIPAQPVAGVPFVGWGRGDGWPLLMGMRPPGRPWRSYLPLAWTSHEEPEPAPEALVVESTPEPVNWGLPLTDGTARTQMVPILMYHHVGELPPGAGRLRRGLTVSPEAFRGHLRYLADAGYQTITVEQLVQHLVAGGPLPPQPVVLSFDDGYRDAYEVVLPILQEFGFVGSFAVVSGPVDDDNPDFMSWEMVAALHQAGMEIAAHSRTHPSLERQTTEYVVWQALGSKEAIESHIGAPVRVFVYPSGDYDDHARQVVRSAMFWAGVTTEYRCLQRSDDLYRLGRVRVTPYDSAASLAEKMAACPTN